MNTVISVNATCAVNEAIQVMKREKVITLLFELVKVKIDHMRVESNHEKKEKIQHNILELIDKLSDV